MFKFIVMCVALLGMIATHIAANSIPFNDVTTWENANRLPVLFMPAGYTYSIWLVIDALLICWIISFYRTAKQQFKSIATIRIILFVLSCILNSFWLCLWHYGHFFWTIALVIALLLSLLGIYFTYPASENRLLERAPISLYMGWIFTSAIANVCYGLTLLEWSGWGLSDPLWAVIFLTFATAIALHFMYHHRDIIFCFVFIWAFIGIAMNNGTEELLVSVAAIFLSIVIAASYFLFPKKNRTSM